MNPSEILSQKSTTHSAPTADRHIGAVFPAERGHRWICDCGNEGEITSFAQADAGLIAHKRASRIK